MPATSIISFRAFSIILFLRFSLFFMLFPHRSYCCCCFYCTVYQLSKNQHPLHKNFLRMGYANELLQFMLDSKTVHKKKNKKKNYNRFKCACVCKPICAWCGRGHGMSECFSCSDSSCNSSCCVLSRHSIYAKYSFILGHFISMATT